MTSLKWTKFLTFDTTFSADSVEWCPHEPHRNIFVCGTYQLNEDEHSAGDGSGSQVRIGRILLFSVSPTENRLICHQQITTAAILDQKWSHCRINGQCLLVVATAVGEIQLYKLDVAEEINLTWMATKRVNAAFDDLLTLSIDWSTGKFPSSQPSLVVSDSKGSVSVVEIMHDTLQISSSWKAHEYEAWICAFDYWNKSLIYSGGDDCLLKMYDVREGTSSMVISRAHSAGVTSIQSNANYEHILASGSYDETLLIWDTRNMKICLSSTVMSGGVWRIKWDPFTKDKILTACMYGSFHILDAFDKSAPSIIGTYSEHSSIAYGCDWCFIEEEPILIATCSFYDHLLNVSKYVPCN